MVALVTSSRVVACRFLHVRAHLSDTLYDHEMVCRKMKEVQEVEVVGEVGGAGAWEGRKSYNVYGVGCGWE